MTDVGTERALKAYEALDDLILHTRLEGEERLLLALERVRRMFRANPELGNRTLLYWLEVQEYGGIET